jgi:hypothetical protein
MASCKNLTQETTPEGAKTITGKLQPSFSAPACTRDHTHVKPQDDQTLSCAYCHTKCVNIMHCKKFGDTWNTNNCQSCHKADPYKKNQE